MNRHISRSLLVAGVTAIFFFTGVAAADPEPAPAPPCATTMPDCPMGIFAAADDAPPAPDAPPGMQGNRPGRRQLEQFRMLKLLELLDLRPDQETDFLVAFKQMRSAHDGIQQERDSLLDLLANGLQDSTLKGQQIYDLVAKIEEVKHKHMQVTTDFLASAKKILTPEQYGRMVVFQERFEFELLNSIRSFRERRGRMHGPMNGMGGGNQPPDDGGY